MIVKSSGAPRDLQFELFSPALGEVLPRRIFRCNQGEPFCSRPRLDLLFRCDCAPDVVEHLVVDQPIDVVPLRESVDFAALCCSARRKMLFVIPVYKLRERLAMMYT